MAVRKASYYSAKVPQRPGAGAQLLAALKSAKVNLLAFTGFPASGGAQVDFIPKDNAKFTQAARKAKIKLSARKTVFLAQGEDRPGALTQILGKLAKAKINVVSLQAVVAGKGRYGAMFWVKRKDVGRASRVLKAR
ncbi:MAG: ACT domain-containing protein [Betaproteobacteria bacterium]|nr:ACT domain-containing protein [Betaproteobacteria bacterium]MDH5576833.1 ACT domain-containing protein [Betaproteobacteria bacterium]